MTNRLHRCARVARAAGRTCLLAGALSLPVGASAQTVPPVSDGLDVARLRISAVAERYLTMVQGTNFPFVEPYPDEYPP